MTHLGSHFGTAAGGAGMERGPLGALVEVVRLHGGDQQGNWIRGGQVRPLPGQPVQPVVVEVPAAHLGPIEQGQQEGAVGSAAFDHDGGVEQCTTESGEGLGAVASPGDNFGDHRVEVGGDPVPFAYACVDAYSGAARQAQASQPARRGGEGVLGILGAYSRLDRMP